MSRGYFDTLVKLGLSLEEAEIYMSLLTNGSQSAADLARTTNVKRTYVYAVCKELITRNIIIQEKQGNTTYFRALSPNHLEKEAESQKHKAEAALLEIKSIIPALQDNFISTQHQSEIHYYEGSDGIKKIYSDIFNERQPISILASKKFLDDEIFHHNLILWYKHGISIRAICSPKVPDRIGNLPEGIKIKSPPDGSVQLNHIIIIYNHKIAFIQWDNKEIGMIIDKEAFVTSFREWFELTWNAFV